MKKPITFNTKHFLWALCMAILSLLWACGKEEHVDDDQLKCPVTSKEDLDNSLIGKWKLIKAHQGFAPTRQESQDYSCDNVIYHFQENDTLIVSGAQEGMISYEDGDYAFAFEGGPAYDGMDGYTVQIGNVSYGGTIQNNKMVLDDSPRDGPRRYFIRVE